MPVVPLAPATAPVARRLAVALEEAARGWRGDHVLRVEVPVGPVDPLAWADAQAGPAVYWRGRSEAEAWAGAGEALAVEAPSLGAVGLDAALEALSPGARLFATARFDASAEVGAEWAPFGAVRFVLPRVDLRTDGRTATMAVHLAPGETVADARSALGALRAPRVLPDDLPLPFMRRDDPDRAEWGRMLRWALGAVEGGGLDKVVLARRARFTFDEAVDAAALLRRLEAATPRCYHALVRPEGGPAFLTATPERLLRLDGRRLRTEAVAGTRPRAEGDAADDALRAELLGSEKDRREHAFVREAIVEALAPLAESVEVDGEAAAMTLARGRHLRTGVRALLRDDPSPLAVLRALHPTPAVGGTPTPRALDAIDRLEPFDRGLYAGPVGWVGLAPSGVVTADLAVGIRSGLVEGRTLSLYSGAGIVAGSDPAAEWAEIEHKIGDFARVLGLLDRLED